jgi:hypothetical protein
MSKQCKKLEQLPLDSPYWMPVAEALRLLRGSLGNSYLAAKDLFAAAAAKCSDKRLPCMQRLIASEVAPDQDRKIVPPADATPVYFAREDAAFFVWRPKFEKIWPALAASAAPHAASSVRDDEPSPAPTAPIDDKPQRRRPGPKIKQNWRLFVAAQVYEIRKREGRTPSAGELAQLCEDEIYYQPDESDIQKFLRILLNE